MNHVYSCEISLRAAVLSAKNKSTSGQDLTESIRLHAFSQLELVQKAEGLVSGIKASDTFEKAAINAAIGAIELAYHAINQSFKEARFKRRDFIQECEQDLSTFVLDFNKEEQEHSYEELAIKSFYELMVGRHRKFLIYSGIEVAEIEEKPNTRLLNILPFFKMSQAIPQLDRVDNKLQEYRQTIFHFLLSGLELQYFYQRFQRIPMSLSKFGALFAARNYLNYYRAPRFIIIAMANLLWHLEYPVDHETGIPLSHAEAAALNYEAEMILNDLLNPRQYPWLEHIDTKSKRLSQCLFKVEGCVKGLRTSYEYEYMHDLNLYEISRHMHSALKIMSNKLFELIYDDEHAAQTLISQTLIMGSLFIQNPNLYHYFIDHNPAEMPPSLNPRPSTIIDVLIIFAHMRQNERLKFCQGLINTYLEPETQLAFQLRQLHKLFLKPFESVAFKELKTDKSSQYKVSAAYLLPLIFLVMQSYTIFRDTRPNKPQQGQAPLSPQEDEFDEAYLTNSKTDKEQCEDILNSTSSSELTDSYYHWSIALFFKSKIKTRKKIDELLDWQNEIRRQNTNLDNFITKIEKNRHELQLDSFRRDLNSLLKRIRNLFTSVNQKFTLIETQMQSNHKIHRDEKRVLQPMLEDLNEILDSIKTCIARTSSIISTQNEGEIARQTLQHICPESPRMRTVERQQVEARSSRRMIMQTLQMATQQADMVPLASTQMSMVACAEENPKEIPRTDTNLEPEAKSDYNPWIERALQAIIGISISILGLQLLTPWLELSLAIECFCIFTGMVSTMNLIYLQTFNQNTATEENFNLLSPKI